MSDQPGAALLSALLNTMARPPRDPIHASRLSDIERQTMLDRLDAADADNPAKNRRGVPRLPYRRNSIAAHIHHPGGSTSACYVATRNLSDGGVSFLYNGFLYKNTKVEVVLPRLGGDDTIAGTVTHCALVHRMYHLVGVKFAEKVFAKVYLTPSEWGDTVDTTPVDHASLRGTLLHLTSVDLDHMMLGHFLKGTAITAVRAKSVAEAAAILRQRPVQCVVCEMPLPLPIESALGQLRQAGYGGPIAVLNPDDRPAVTKAIQTAGATAVLAKPFDGPMLLTLLVTWLQNAKAA
ncbi:MAG TPA: response regulator [Tepidisphaeraceae bacterium]|jgi:CheY-like chemotaxis protein